ncbi:MAG: M13 family metallopeptidase [Bryobacteraceae bacterium]|nr:M13 family metallopeptidase [Bryobacteraceae bacterium]
MRAVALLVLLFSACAAPAAERESLRALLDESCKPCEDFFEYVNRKWLAANPIPPSQSRWGRLSKMVDDNRERLKTILEEISSDAEAGKLAKGSQEEKIAYLYGSCMDTGTLAKRGIAAIREDLDRIEAIRDIDGLSKEIVHLLEIGVTAPISLDSTSDFKNSNEVIAELSAGGLSLPDRDFYFRTDERSVKIREEFKQHVVRMHKLLGDSDQQAEKAAATVMAIETRLAGSRLTNVERRDPYKRYHRMDLASVSKLAPAFDWVAAFRHFGLPRTTPVNVTEPKFYEAFQMELTGTPISEWKTYLRWRLVKAMAPRLSQEFEDEAFAFDGKLLRGVKEQLPRWQRCAMAVDSSLGEALGQAYVRKYFPPAAKKRMDELVTNMRLTLRDELSQATWLSEQTKQQAIAKLDRILPKIGYPDKWRDYSALTIRKGRYAENMIHVARFRLRHELNKIGKPLDKTEWFMTPPTVNAYYNPQWNEIAFPAGILQPPFFDMEADDAENYGAIGAIIGHEIGHGFDDKGSQFDAEGNLRNWWTDTDRKKFEERAACIVEQFESFEVQPGLRHIGKLVTGEALGDLGGLTLAYKAYHRSLKGKPAPIIDGLTGDQRFFISFARLWGTQSRQEYERLQLQTDPHPAPRSRANETLKNIPEFREAFGCKLGDPMVRPPEKQCKLS